MNNMDIINYIEKNIPEVVFNPIQLPGKLNAVGFVVTENKLVIGFVKRDGSLCKLMNPIDLVNFSNKELVNIISRIPIVNGFSENDKKNLLRIFSTMEAISSETEQKQAEKDLKNFIQLPSQEYTPIYDSNSEQIVLLKREYEEQIANYKQQIDQSSLKNKQVIEDKDILIEKIKDYQKRLNEYLFDISVGMKESYGRIKSVVENIRTDRDNIKKLLDTMKRENPELEREIKEASEQISQYLNSLNQKDLEIKMLREYKTKCAKEIHDDKERIIETIKGYNEKWKEALGERDINYELATAEIKREYQIVTSQLERLQRDNNLTTEENQKLKDAIRELQIQLDKVSTEQIIELQKKYADEIDRKTREVEEERRKNEELQQQFKKFEQLNAQEVYTQIKAVDYESCKQNSIAINFSRVNDTLLRALEKVKILRDDILQSEGVDTKLLPEQKEMVLGKLNGIAERIQIHVNYFFNLKDYNIEENIRKLQNKEVKTDDTLQNFCTQIADITNYWKAAEADFIQDMAEITNLYEDVAGAVRVFIRIKSHPVEKTFQIPPQNPNMLLADCPGSKGFYGPFYGIFNEEFKNQDVFTGSIDRDAQIQNDLVIPDTFNYSQIGLYNTFRQVESGYSTVIFSYGYSGSGKSHSIFGNSQERGLIHYAFANLKNVSKINILHAFELYKNKVAVQENYISGKVINLVGSIPSNIPKEVVQNEIIINQQSLDIDNLTQQLNELTRLIEQQRQSTSRIKATPNNPVSSRSHLFLVFEIQFLNGTTGYITFVDMAGRESPLDLYDLFLDKQRITLSTAMRMGVSKREREKLQVYINPDFTDYDINDIYDILQEGFYVNESINHLTYFFEKKNFKQSQVFKQRRIEDYNVKNFYINPKDEEIGKIDVSPTNPRNCLMIPILQYLDGLGQIPNEFKPSKFVMLCNVRQEKNKCSEILETLEFANSIKST